jgi:hypothetical protein
LHIPEEQDHSVEVTDLLHPATQLGSSIEGVEESLFNALTQIVSPASGPDLEDGRRRRLPPIGVGEETADDPRGRVKHVPAP